jgi:hypothetical protein
VAERTLADIPASKVWQAQQAALMRLQLYLVLRTHEMLRAVLADCRDALDEAYQGSGVSGQDTGAWDALSIHLAIDGVTQAWRKHFTEWKGLFEALRWEAGSLPFGTLAVLHAAAFQGSGGRGQESGVRGQGTGDRGQALNEAGGGVVFEPQLQGLLDAAADRVWGDGFKLSQRIWRLDQESLEGIRKIVYEGIAKGDSAWNIAKKLEPFLGAGQDCPRWARSRLNKLTKSDIASGDRTGLYTGDDCDGQGVAYNALRLSRNEVQIAQHRANDAILARIPWIEKIKIHLSPAHPETDICDDVISNGENGEGIYPKGEDPLPIHPNCLCYSVAVLLPPDAFADKLHGWLGGESWPEMDEYAGGLGTGRAGIAGVNLAVGITQRILVWLWSSPDDLDAAVAGTLAAAE